MKDVIPVGMSFVHVLVSVGVAVVVFVVVDVVVHVVVVNSEGNLRTVTECHGSGVPSCVLPRETLTRVTKPANVHRHR